MNRDSSMAKLSSLTSWNDRQTEVLDWRRNEHLHQDPQQAPPNWALWLSRPPMEQAKVSDNWTHHTHTYNKEKISVYPHHVELYIHINTCTYTQRNEQKDILKMLHGQYPIFYHTIDIPHNKHTDMMYVKLYHILFIFSTRLYRQFSTIDFTLSNMKSLIHYIFPTVKNQLQTNNLCDNFLRKNQTELYA